MDNELYETATVVAIERNHRIQVNRRNSYRVICRIERMASCTNTATSRFTICPR